MREAGEPALITGGAGFIGANLADRLATAGRTIIILDSLARAGVEKNLEWLRSKHGARIIFAEGDIRDIDVLRPAVEAAGDVIHLAAQVAVTNSIENPIEDFSINATGTLNLLEEARKQTRPPNIVFASTNKVYGALKDCELDEGERRYRAKDTVLDQYGVSETQPIDFRTPYGCSKGAADQYVLDYARQYGLPAAVLRMSCIYGPRQFGTEDQGWVAHFLISARAGREITLFGDGKQVRDILHVHDAVNAYLAVLDNPHTARGKAYNLGGGAANAVSLLEVLEEIEELLDTPVSFNFAEPRAGDQRYFVTDTRRLERELDWRPRIHWREGVKMLNAWLESEGRALAKDEEEAA